MGSRSISYGLLDQSEEDALHASRLLNVEEKLLRRIQKRLLAPEAMISNVSPQAPPTPPPDGDAIDEAALAKEKEQRAITAERNAWREDMILDFAAFGSNVTRAQFLLDSNEAERQRYAQEVVQIRETAQYVKESNTQLHVALQEAQRTLATRKTYDALANDITRNKALKPRDEQHANLAKLNAEIGELEREGEEYKRTWQERREQFNKIVEEGMQMLRLIRDEKEEAERKEGMESIDEGEGTPKAQPSRASTPKPEDDSSTPKPVNLALKAVEAQEKSFGIRSPVGGASPAASAKLGEDNREEIDEPMLEAGELEDDSVQHEPRTENDSIATVDEKTTDVETQMDTT